MMINLSKQTSTQPHYVSFLKTNILLILNFFLIHQLKLNR